MRYNTKLMRKILTNALAQDMVDWISPLYGESYVGLWLLQVIGSAMAYPGGVASGLLSETSPATADVLLGEWENHYDIPPDPALTIEERRAQLLAKLRATGPCNPARLEQVASAALGGAGVRIIENTGDYEFTVAIAPTVQDYSPAEAALRKITPAHLVARFQADYNTHGLLSAKTHSQLASFTHQELREDPDVRGG